MQLVEYNSFIAEGRNAASKAKQDVSVILHRMGCRNLYNPSKNRLVRIIQQACSLFFLSKSTLLFIQYPSNIPFFYRFLRHKKKIKTIVIIHDLESLRDRREKEIELDLFNGFDYIISHNPSMTKYLKDNGVIKPIYNLMIFDYLLKDNIQVNNIFDFHTVFFAGNLIKSKFLGHLGNIRNIIFNIYGDTFDGIDTVISQANINYKGSYSPESLISNLEGGWGLVWDGDEIETCSGMTGEYLRYNNPHKVSMILVSERPVIIWKQAAMAGFIESQGLGILVESLLELPQKIEKISRVEYETMRANVKRLKAKLSKGEMLKGVITTIF